MAGMNSYSNFDGAAEEAFNFYKSVAGEEFMSFNCLPGTLLMEMRDNFRDAYLGSFKHKYGIGRMINYDKTQH